jgi:C_GCAxxG_C_C family probable redox protein
MGRLGKTCGAATGALMVIGLKHGASFSDDEAAKQKTFQLVRDFIRHFEIKNGTSVCRELIGYDLTTEEGVKAARASGVFQRACPQYIRDAVNILAEMGF